MAAAVAGLVLVLDLTGAAAPALVGVLWGLLAAVGLAAYFVTAADDGGLPPVALAAFGMVAGAVGAGRARADRAAADDLSTAPVQVGGTALPAWLAVAELAVVAAALAYLLGTVAARRLGSTVASFVGLTEVLFAVLFAWLLLGELPAPVQLAGGALIIGGVVAVRAGELGRGGPTRVRSAPYTEGSLSRRYTLVPTARPAEPGCSSRPGPDPAHHSPPRPASIGDAMTVLLSVLGLLAVAALTLGTAISVASEFALTALERSQVDAHVAEVGDRRAHAVQRAHRSLSFQLSGSQLGITLTTLATGYIAEPAIAELFRPGLVALGLSDGGGRRHRDRAGPGAGHHAVHGVRRAGAQEPGHRRPAAHRPRRGLAAGRFRRRLPLADHRAERLGERDRAPARAWSPPRSCARPARRASSARWSGPAPSAAPWTRAPPRCWTGRCGSPTGSPRT